MKFWRPGITGKLFLAIFATCIVLLLSLIHIYVNADDVRLDAKSQQAARAKATAWLWSHVGSPATRLWQVAEMGAQSRCV